MRGLQGFASQATAAYGKLNDTLQRLIPTVAAAGKEFGLLRDQLRQTIPLIDGANRSLGRMRTTIATTIPLVGTLTAQFAQLGAVSRGASVVASSSMGSVAASALKAAAGASTASAGFAAILAPLAGIAAVAAVAYVAIAKWDKVPTLLKPILLIMSPLVLAIRAVATAWSIATAPMRAFLGTIALVKGAVSGLVNGVVGLSTSLVRGLASAATAAVKLGVSLAKSLVSGAVAAFGALRNLAQAGLGMFSRLAGVLQSAGSSLLSTANTIVKPLENAAQMFAVAGTAALGFAAATGMSVEAVQAFGYAAEQSGSSVEAMAAASETLNAKLAEADAGSAAAAASFRALGLDVGKLLSMSPEDRFTEVGVAIASLADPLERAQAASAVFGSSATSLIEMFGKGAAGLAEMRREAERLGLVMGGPQAKAAKELTAAQQLLKDSLSGLWRTLGAAVAPQLAETAKNMASVVQAVTAWVRQNQPLIAQVFRIASTIAGVGTALTTLASILAVATPGVVALTAAAAAGWLAWRQYGDAAKSALGVVGEVMADIYDETLVVLGGIWDAIKGGDLELAVQIAWLGAQKAWSVGLQAIADMFGYHLGGMIDALASGDWGSAAEQAWMAIQEAWSHGMDYLDGLWVSLQNTIDGVMTYMQQQANVAIQYLSQLAMAALEKVSAVAKVLEKYDPTGTIGKAKVGLGWAAREAGLTRAAAGDPAAANADLAAASQARMDARGAALDDRRNGRAGFRAMLDEEQFNAATRSGQMADDKGIDIQRRLNAALNAAAAARDAAQRKDVADIDRRNRLQAAANSPDAYAAGFGAQFSGAALLAMNAPGKNQPQERAAKAAEATAKGVAELVALAKDPVKRGAQQLVWSA